MIQRDNAIIKDGKDDMLVAWQWAKGQLSYLFSINKLTKRLLIFFFFLLNQD